MIFGINLCTMRHQFLNQRRAGFPVSRKLTRRQEKASRAVAQHVGIINLFALELGHGNRLDFGRRRLTTAQQLASITTGLVGATKVLTEAPGFELHLGTALVTLKRRPFVTLDLE